MTPEFLLERIHEHLDCLEQIELDRRADELLRGAKYEDPKKLSRYEHKVFSQGGEDGILAEIFKRIGITNRIFAECSPGDGLENNTLYLLTLGWKGCWVECDPIKVDAITQRMRPRIAEGSLFVQQQTVTAENIESLFTVASLPREFDLLSIDVDANDYWVWEKIQRFRPRVVVIEYNATFPASCDWVMERNPKGVWDGTINFGASLRAFERLGRSKGYALVGCSLTGVNAFFVRGDLTGGRFFEPFTAENHYEPPRYYLASRRAGHRRGPAWGVVQLGPQI